MTLLILRLVSHLAEDCVEAFEVLDGLDDAAGRPHGAHIVELILVPGDEGTRVATANNDDLTGSFFSQLGLDEAVDIVKSLSSVQVLQVFVRPATLGVRERLRITVVPVLESNQLGAKLLA